MYHPNFKDTLVTSPYIFTFGVTGDDGSGKTRNDKGGYDHSHKKDSRYDRGRRLPWAQCSDPLSCDDSHRT